MGSSVSKFVSIYDRFMENDMTFDCAPNAVTNCFSDVDYSHSITHTQSQCFSLMIL